MAVKFIGTVSAVAVSITGEMGLDAIAIGASEQIPETCRVSSDTIGLIRSVGTVGFSVANVGSVYTVWSIQFPHALELVCLASGSLLSFRNI